VLSTMPLAASYWTLPARWFSVVSVLVPMTTVVVQLPTSMARWEWALPSHVGEVALLSYRSLVILAFPFSVPSLAQLPRLAARKKEGQMKESGVARLT
jgi:hypothetical protein